MKPWLNLPGGLGEKPPLPVISDKVTPLEAIKEAIVKLDWREQQKIYEFLYGLGRRI
jgi:hypothetical protein